jgi:hypothetical protein
MEIASICYNNALSPLQRRSRGKTEQVKKLSQLVNSQYPSALSLAGLLALVALVEGCSFLQRPTEVVGLLNLVDTDNPVLAGEGLLDGAELGADSGQLGAADAVLSLASRKEGVVVVVGHLVHQAVLHGVCGLVVDAVFATGGEEVALLDLVGPDAWEWC